ncbi:hypothetical protein ABZ807_18340 [Micromonospora sp. NPDC047548]
MYGALPVATVRTQVAVPLRLPDGYAATADYLAAKASRAAARTAGSPSLT